MTFVFVDAASLIAIGDKRDRFHQQALAINEELIKSKVKFLTTDAVVLEIAGYFSQSKRRSTAVALIETIKHSRKWKCIAVDETLMNRGLDRYRNMADKDWSLVDCISMLVAKDYGIADIFTTDHHFEQAGFVILLK